MVAQPVSIPNKPARERWGVLIAVATGILAVFALRTILAHTGGPPRLFTIFNALTLLGSLAVLGVGHRALKLGDWLLAGAVSACLGILLSTSTFYHLIPLNNPPLSVAAHAAGLAAIWLAGLVVMRRGGPVSVQSAQGNWGQALTSLAFGTALGLPLAVLNAWGLSEISGRSFTWQNPLVAAANALQPGIVEEVVYRLSFLGLIWLLLKGTWPRKAVPLSASFSLLVHNYAHFDELFRDQPLFALGYGAVLALVFGLPMTLLAVRRDLESAIGLHWAVDFVRFLAGF